MFTERTFAALRKSVRKSMKEDAALGLPTGQAIEVLIHPNFNHYTLCHRFPELGRKIHQTQVDVENSRVSYREIASGRYVEGQKLGRLLRQHTEASDEAIKRFVNDYSGRKAWVCFTKYHINKHYRVMKQQLNLESCMAYAPGRFGRLRPHHERFNGQAKYIHPTEVYEKHADIRLALVSFRRDRDKGYPFDGRAICAMNDDQVIFVRCYGKEYCHMAFSKAMKEVSNLDGFLLPVICCNEGMPVMPYIDFDNRFTRHSDHWWEIAGYDGEYEADWQSGRVDEAESNYCAHCEENHSEDDDYIYTDNGRIYGCCREYYVIPVGHDEYCHRDNCYYSHYHSDYVDEDEAQEYIELIDQYRNVDLDHIHEDHLDSASSVVELYIPFQCYRYAASDLCVETEDGDWFLENAQQGEYRYCCYDQKPYTIDAHDWHEVPDGLVVDINRKDYCNDNDNLEAAS